MDRLIEKNGKPDLQRQGKAFSKEEWIDYQLFVLIIFSTNTKQRVYQKQR